MVKRNPENAATRAKSDEDQFRVDSRHFSGPIPRSMEVFAAGLGSSVGASRRANGHDGLESGSASLCTSHKTEKSDKKPKGVDFGDAIGKELQNIYDDLVAQPVPDRFLNLLNQLEKNMISSGVSNSAPGERE